MEENRQIPAFLNTVYRNAEAGISAINALLAKTDDDRLKADLQKQLHSLRTIEAEAVRKLKLCGEEPKGLSMTARMGMRMGLAMNTALDHSPARLAELMIKGNNMGIIDLTRAMNRHGTVNTNAGELASRLLEIEQSALDKFKGYL